MAYVLGFFAADGYITVNRRGGQFWCIQITDRELLEKIKKTINSKHKISVRLATGNRSCSYRLQIGSIEMCDDLRRLGFRENKTKSLAIPKVPEPYLSDFVRGYFDGDGNVWMGRVHKKGKVVNFALLTMFTSCSVTFLRSLHERLISNGIEGGCIYSSKKNYSRLQFSIRDSLKLYDFMYNSHILDNSLFLERKKSVFEKYKSLRL